MLSLFLVPGDPLSGIQDTVIRNTPSCVGCTIEATLLRSIGGAESHGIIGEPLSVAVDDDGNTFVIPGIGTPPVAFDSRGNFAGSFGRIGRGPGELAYPRHLWVRGDSLQVLDAMGGQIVTFSVSTRRAIATLSIPRERYLWAVQLPSGGLIANGPFDSPAAAGQPFIELDPGGGYRGAFGADSAGYRFDEAWRMTRLLAMHGTDGIWSGLPYEYVIELFKLSDRSRPRRLVRQVSWFPQPPAGERPSSGVGGRTPWPRLRAIWEDKAGLLWLAVDVVSPDWRTNAPRPDEPRLPGSHAYARWDGVIDVLDPFSGQLIVSGSVPFNAIGVVGDGIVTAYREDADGSPFLDFWRLTVRKPGSTNTTQVKGGTT